MIKLDRYEWPKKTPRNYWNPKILKKKLTTSNATYSVWMVFKIGSHTLLNLGLCWCSQFCGLFNLFEKWLRWPNLLSFNAEFIWNTTSTLKVNCGLIWLQGINMKSQSGVVYISQAITFGITTANPIDDSKERKFQ